MVKVAVVGCAHGSLDAIYETLEEARSQCGEQANVDVLLICGDFQAVRNKSDLACMMCPEKYKSMGSFHEYYSGAKQAPVLTIFIGGNHEASNYLQELWYGGWVAPNIYYLGYAGVVNVKGLRIAGISGIYNASHFTRHSYERPPYSENTARSVYHARSYQIHQLRLLTGNIDVFLSHDWPRGIARHGNTNELLRKKKFLRQEVMNNTLGNPGTEELLYVLKPKYWFAGHMHVKFPAIVQHSQHQHDPTTTNFLSLDKCLPGRDFLQILDIPPSHGTETLTYDLEWLSILRTTHRCITETTPPYEVPIRESLSLNAEKLVVSFENNFAVPVFTSETFPRTAPTYVPPSHGRRETFHRYRNPLPPMPGQQGNPQTDTFLSKMQIQHCPPITVPYIPATQAGTGSTSKDDNEIDLDV